MHFKKNSVLISVVVLLLCVAVYLNWNYEHSEKAKEATAGKVLDDAQTQGAVEAAVSDEERFEENRWEIETGAQESAAGDERLTKLCSDMDEMRLSLETSRSGELSLLWETIENEESTVDAKASAEAQMAAIAANSVTEAKIENLLLAKGFVDCIALLGDDGISVVIVPEKPGLEASDVAKISDVILAETDLDTTQIRVIESQ